MLIRIVLFLIIIKAELTQILQSLSGKAKTASEFVTKLKTLPELMDENASKTKNVLVAEIDDMIRNLEAKKKDLVELIDAEKAARVKLVRDQVGGLSSRINKTTGLLQYCVETLKEQDPSSFLLVKKKRTSYVNYNIK